MELSQLRKLPKEAECPTVSSLTNKFSGRSALVSAGVSRRLESRFKSRRVRVDLWISRAEQKNGQGKGWVRLILLQWVGAAW